MKYFSLKKMVPRSLFGRFLLIIILPMVMAQIVATYMFYQRHWSTVSEHMANALTGEVAFIAHASQHASWAEKEKLFHMAQKYLYLKSVFSKNEELVSPHPIAEEELQMLYNHLALSMPYPFSIDYYNDKRDVLISVQLPKGVLHVMASRKRFATPTTYIFVSWMVGSGSFLLLISILFMRNQIRSISRLAVAAEEFGKGREMPSFKPSGAKEVRQAAMAFLRMKERIERQILQRTDMLTGVSHDLRTPLTRLKLELAMLEPHPSLEDMQHDIADMEHMIEEYLAFARGEEGEASLPIVLSALINEVLAGYRSQNKCTLHFTIEKDAMLSLKAHAIKRALTNLIDNALRYSTRIQLLLKTTREYALVFIEDNGPGIPATEREAVFKPFYRLDSSRNLQTGGVGLGLAITRDIITNHGGKIELSESRSGGLMATIFLPL